MLLRQIPDGILAITQPWHAWLSGELAAVWGAPGFLIPEPRDAIICAVALHDIGWVEWERAPRLDEATGLPLTFNRVEAKTHTALWTAGVEAASVYGQLPALHVSRHGIAIYDRTFAAGTARPEQAEVVEQFRAHQGALQAEIVAKLARDPATAPWVSREHLELTRAFILAVDTISLHLCWGVDGMITVSDVPRADGPTNIVLSKGSNGEVEVDPWPFTPDRLTLTIEGKRIKPVPGQDELDRMMSEATTEYHRTVLVPRLR